VPNTADSATFSIRGWEAHQKIENASLREKKPPPSLSLPNSDGIESGPPATFTRKHPSIEAVNYTLGTELVSEEYHGLITELKRSTLLAVQAKMESTEEPLNQRIAGALERAGISFSEDERLDFSIDQDGRITVGERIADTEKRWRIEAALNGDGNIKNDLLLQQARKIVFEKRTSDTRIAQTIVYDSYAWATGQSSDLPGAEKSNLRLIFRTKTANSFRKRPLRKRASFPTGSIRLPV
jgi:hypothetical protein